jgi:putative SOS response-associated peptidase YedK
MCGRYAFFAPREAIERVFGVVDPPEIEPRYNIAPSQFVPIVRVDRDGKRVLRMVRWGLVPFWARDESIGNRMINARAETLSTNAAFREAFEQRRCLIPVSGFYEWRRDGRASTPWYVESAAGEPFALAGLWARWRPRNAAKEAPPLDSCTIITAPASALLAPIHDRMPVIVPAEAFAAWLDPQMHDPAALGRWLEMPRDEELTTRVVSRAVNDARSEGVELIAPFPGESPL